MTLAAFVITYLNRTESSASSECPYLANDIVLVLFPWLPASFVCMHARSSNAISVRSIFPYGNAAYAGRHSAFMPSLEPYDVSSADYVIYPEHYTQVRSGRKTAHALKGWCGTVRCML